MPRRCQAYETGLSFSHELPNMETGLILALIAALGFACCVVVVRKATTQAGESFTTTEFSAYIGAVIFAVIIPFTGGWSQLLAISGRAWLLLVMAGILHFILGRLLGYEAYRLIGANKATPLVMTNPFYTLILSILFLKESLGFWEIIGVVCIFGGAVLITTERKSVADEVTARQALPVVPVSGEGKGILVALAAAICWGVSPVLIKPAVTEIGSPIVGVFIAYMASAMILALFLTRRHYREQIANLRRLKALTPVIISGVLGSLGQMFNFMALARSPASLVSPITSTNGLFIFFISFLINRRIELFTLRIILGIVATLAGTFLIFW